MTAPSPALLWIHGGGYVMGTAAMDDAVCRHFARELGIVVASVDYRLAPEFPFPTPLHDCHDALAWLAGRPEVDAARIAIGGASAGAGLAAALALLARERAEVRHRRAGPVLRRRHLVCQPPDSGRCRMRTTRGRGRLPRLRPKAGVSQEFRAAQTKALAAVLN